MSAILTSDSEQSSVMDSVPPTKKKKRETQPTCSLCKIHNLKILSSAHKGRCLGLYCICKKCEEKKQSRNKSAEDTKKDREKKKEQERQARIKLIGSELIKAEPKQDIIPFLIPEEDKEKLPKAIDEAMLKIIKFVKKTEEIIFTGHRERKRKLKRDEEDSSEKRLKLDFPLETTSINKFEDLFRYALYNCLMGDGIQDSRYGIQDVITTVLSLMDEIVTIILECTISSEDTEKSLDEAKSRISLVSQKIHRLIESYGINCRKCLQEKSVQYMYSLNGIDPLHPLWPWFLNHTTLTNIPCTEILPKPSTVYPYYRPNTNV